MPYTPFEKRFPEIARSETRSIRIINHRNLPSDHYGFLEFFCDEAGCDCRRVFWYVVTEHSTKPLAVICYGWESKEFYQKWYGHNDPEEIEELKGPVLNRMSPQSKIAPQLLALVKDTLIPDSKYIKRVIKHYQMFRKKVDEEGKGRPVVAKTLVSTSPKVGRNEPCPCGSGKKYKHCCMH